MSRESTVRSRWCIDQDPAHSVTWGHLPEWVTPNASDRFGMSHTSPCLSGRLSSSTFWEHAPHFAAPPHSAYGWLCATVGIQFPRCPQLSLALWKLLWSQDTRFLWGWCPKATGFGKSIVIFQTGSQFQLRCVRILLWISCAAEVLLLVGRPVVNFINTYKEKIRVFCTQLRPPTPPDGQIPLQSSEEEEWLSRSCQTHKRKPGRKEGKKRVGRGSMARSLLGSRSSS